MRIQPNIDVTVSVFYLDIEGLRCKPQYGTDREADLYRLMAKASLEDDGSVRSPWITASGHYVKKDGTTGLQTARIQFGSMSTLPEEWQARITRDLDALAAHVTVASGAEQAVSA